MKYLLFLLFPVCGYGQTYSQASIGADFPSNRIGVSVSAGAGQRFGKLFNLGAGLGVTKIQNTAGVTVPVFLHLSLAPSDKKVFPVLIFQPGYGIYNHVAEFITSGGFTYYVGGGIGFSMDKVKLSINAGYSRYTFFYDRTEGIDKGFSVRLGIMSL